MVDVVYFATNVREDMTDYDVLIDVVGPVTVLVMLLAAIYWRTGEQPKWQWGEQSEKKRWAPRDT